LLVKRALGQCFLERIQWRTNLCHEVLLATVVIVRPPERASCGIFDSQLTTTRFGQFSEGTHIACFQQRVHEELTDRLRQCVAVTFSWPAPLLHHGAPLPLAYRLHGEKPSLPSQFCKIRVCRSAVRFASSLRVEVQVHPRRRFAIAERKDKVNSRDRWVLL